MYNSLRLYTDMDRAAETHFTFSKKNDESSGQNVPNL